MPRQNGSAYKTVQTGVGNSTGSRTHGPSALEYGTATGMDLVGGSNGRGMPITEPLTRNWQDVLRHIQQRHAMQPRVPLAIRVFEFTIAAITLLLTAPIILLLAVLVRSDSPGGALFQQDRVGRGGKLFRFTKFRTLLVDAKQRFPELYAYRYTPEEIDRLCFKVPNDPRITRVGRWLRKSTLDELPNFWHVLTGEMALVGPRPEIPEMLPYYTEEELIKFSVRPGITGIPQISGRGRLRFREAAALDVYYVQNRTFVLDLRIMFRTLYLIMRRDGAF
jgi:lipopolysaccharide/colanic/teichoic acid biosynthesis glycosyltransferase